MICEGTWKEKKEMRKDVIILQSQKTKEKHNFKSQFSP